MISLVSKNSRKRKKKKGICTCNDKGNNKPLPPNITGFPAMLSSSFRQTALLRSPHSAQEKGGEKNLHLKGATGFLSSVPSFSSFDMSFPNKEDM